MYLGYISIYLSICYIYTSECICMYRCKYTPMQSAKLANTATDIIVSKGLEGLLKVTYGLKLLPFNRMDCPISNYGYL